MTLGWGAVESVDIVEGRSPCEVSEASHGAQRV